MNEFFGRKPGQNIKEFQDELKQLDDNDRKYFIEEFKKIGIEVEQKAA